MEPERDDIYRAAFDAIEKRALDVLTNPRQAGKSAMFGARYGTGRLNANYYATEEYRAAMEAVCTDEPLVVTPAPTRAQLKSWQKGYIPRPAGFKLPGLQPLSGWSRVDGKYSQWPYLIKGSALLGWTVTHVEAGKVWRGRDLEAARVWVELDKGHRAPIKLPGMGILSQMIQAQGLQRNMLDALMAQEAGAMVVHDEISMVWPQEKL